MIYNIDFHGTIATDLHDQWVKVQVQKGRSLSDSSSVWDDYARFVSETKEIVLLNPERIGWMCSLKDQGHTLRLFTNVNYTLEREIKSILKEYVPLFDSFIFCDGKKSRMQVEGIVVDNEKQNLKCGLNGGILVPTFKHEVK